MQPWRMCERQPDAVVTEDHSVGRCMASVHEGKKTPEEQRAQEMEWYGGHFVCESVQPEFRPLVTAAPELRAVLEDAISDTEKRYAIARRASDVENTPDPLPEWVARALALIQRIEGP